VRVHLLGQPKALGLGLRRALVLEQAQRSHPRRGGAVARGSQAEELTRDQSAEGAQIAPCALASSSEGVAT
jgi:hypothetical protein